jgi:hypothetical protein
MRELEGQRQSLRQPTAAAACRDLALDLSLATRFAFSNWLTAPRICLTSTAIGVSVVKKSGADVGTNPTPSERR